MNAQRIQQPTLVESTDGCLQETGDDVYWFRLQLDGSFASAEGSIQLITTTIDGYPASSQIPMLFRHAPPVINGTIPTTVEAGSDLTLQLTITDLDGLGDVSCATNVSDDNNSIVWQKDFQPFTLQDSDGQIQLRWPVPRNLNESTDALQIVVNCEDSDGETGSWMPAERTSVEPYVCRINCNTTANDLIQTESSTSVMPYVVLGLGLLVVLFVTSMFVRKEGSKEKWATDESIEDFDALTTDSIAEAEASLLSMAQDTSPPIPDGWTEDAFVNWLNGERPEDWTDEQWDAIREEYASRLKSSSEAIDEIEL